MNGGNLLRVLERSGYEWRKQRVKVSLPLKGSFNVAKRNTFTSYQPVAGHLKVKHTTGRKEEKERQIRAKKMRQAFEAASLEGAADEAPAAAAACS